MVTQWNDRTEAMVKIRFRLPAFGWAALMLAIMAFVMGGTPVTVSPAAAQQAPARAITQIAGDLYRFQNGGHYSVFLVTPAGVIATDPINADAARWLKAEIAKRFNQPIRYLIYSHDHADHIEGGEVFADTAIVVAHEKAKEHIVGEKRKTAVPQVTFSDRMVIELGGKTVELHYLGRNHGDNSVVMRFPAERVVFAVDFVEPGRLPFRDLRNGYVEDWIDSLKRLEAMDFDIFASGHTALARKDEVFAVRAYLEQLRAEVLALVREGKSVDEIKAAVKMEKYKSWTQYETFLPLNIEGMVQHVKLYRR
jgi:glyoxylase-like metal-dependent hydrolase (beta-lactamase superfamily II)